MCKMYYQSCVLTVQLSVVSTRLYCECYYINGRLLLQQCGFVDRDPVSLPPKITLCLSLCVNTLIVGRGAVNVIGRTLLFAAGKIIRDAAVFG
jgi:hypothetical protein